MVGRKLVWIAALALLAGCGPLQEARDAARGVDDAVSLLQALEDRGAWAALRDGATALEDLDHGYAAALQAQNPGAAPLAVEIQADADDEMLLTLTRPGAESAETYYLTAQRDAGMSADVYRLADGRYACANAEADFLRGGLGATMQHLTVSALGPELLAVRAMEGDEVTQLDRAATRYALEARRADAVRILRELENADLAARVQTAGKYDLSGTITLDDATGALLTADAVTTAPGDGGEARLSFAVTQWDAAEDIPTPDAAAITQPCPQPASAN